MVVYVENVQQIYFRHCNDDDGQCVKELGVPGTTYNECKNTCRIGAH